MVTLSVGDYTHKPYCLISEKTLLLRQCRQSELHRDPKELPPKRVEIEQAEETRKLEAKQELRRQIPTGCVVSLRNFRDTDISLGIPSLVTIKNDPNPDKILK